MFLDAALMLRGRPVPHLLAYWEGALLCDASLKASLPSRTSTESHAHWQSRRAVAAAKLAKLYLDDLHAVSLIKFDHSAYDGICRRQAPR